MVKSSGDLSKAIAEIQKKVEDYRDEKLKAETKLGELQVLAVLGKSVPQDDLTRLTTQIQDLEQKLRAARFTVEKFEKKKIQAEWRESTDRLTKINKELDDLYRKQKEGEMDLVKTLAFVAIQLETIKWLSAEKFVSRLEGRHFMELKNVLQASKDLFFSELMKMDRGGKIEVKIRELKKERDDILLAEQKMEKEADQLAPAMVVE